MYVSYFTKIENIAYKHGYRFYNLPKQEQKILNRVHGWINQQLDS